MNILLINHYAGSPDLGMEYRPYYFARRWVQEGHRVTIAASSFSHLRKRNPEFEGSHQEAFIDGIRYFWLRGIRYQGNGVRRALSMFEFVFKLLRFSGDLSRDRPDLVIASSTYPIDIFAAWWIARKNSARLVFEVHDLWPLSPMELGGMSQWHPFIMVMQWAENFACRFSDQVVSLLPSADAHLIQHGMRPEKFHYVPNGISLEEWNEAQDLAPELLKIQVEKERSEGCFTVAYAGAHGVANSLDTLLEAASLLKKKPVKFYLIGQGPEKAALQKKAHALGLTNVAFIDSVPKTSIPAVLELFDCLYIGLQRQPLFRFGISPNKMMDYMMAAKPILCAIEAGNDMVSEANCGVTVAPEDASAVAGALERIWSMSPDERIAMGQRGRAYVTKNHDYEALAQNFLDKTVNR